MSNSASLHGLVGAYARLHTHTHAHAHTHTHRPINHQKLRHKNVRETKSDGEEENSKGNTTEFLLFLTLWD